MMSSWRRWNEPLRTAHQRAAIRFRAGRHRPWRGDTGLSLVGGENSLRGLTGEGDLSANVVECGRRPIRSSSSRLMAAYRPGGMIGRHISPRRRGLRAPSTYTLTVSSRRGERWALLNMTQTLAHGVIKSVGRRAPSPTPVMKLRVNPGLFDGNRFGPATAHAEVEHRH